MVLAILGLMIVQVMSVQKIEDRPEIMGMLVLMIMPYKMTHGKKGEAAGIR